MANVERDLDYICCKCGKSLSLRSSFYKATSDLYLGTTRLPICRTCITELFEEYMIRYKDPRLSMQRICMAFDLYYNEAIFDKYSGNLDTIIGNYLKCLNMNQHRGKTFDTTLQEGFTFKKEAKKKDYKGEPAAVVIGEEASSEDIAKWGDGLSSTDYKSLNNHYEFLKNANPNCDSNQEIFIIDLCYIKMQQMKAIRESRPDDYSKMAEQYRKSFSQAGLKTVRDASADEDFTLGVNIEMIEKYTPAEYYKDKELFKDIDSIGDYITRFITRPLRNLQFGTTDRDHEYYIKDEEAANEYSDD